MGAIRMGFDFSYNLFLLCVNNINKMKSYIHWTCVGQLQQQHTYLHDSRWGNVESRPRIPEHVTCFQSRDSHHLSILWAVHFSLPQVSDCLPAKENLILIEMLGTPISRMNCTMLIPCSSAAFVHIWRESSAYSSHMQIYHLTSCEGQTTHHTLPPVYGFVKDPGTL